jgi:formylglycine-generating enzyme
MSRILLPRRSASEGVPAGMTRIPAGEFMMGSDAFYPEERPVHRVAVDGFLIDTTPVTVEQFRLLVRQTGHVTTAEVAPAAADYPGADPALLVPGSFPAAPCGGGRGVLRTA